MKGVLTGFVVAMVTYYVEEMTTTFSPMTSHLFDIVIVVSTDKEW